MLCKRGLSASGRRGNKLCSTDTVTELWRPKASIVPLGMGRVRDKGSLLLGLWIFCGGSAICVPWEAKQWPVCGGGEKGVQGGAVLGMPLSRQMGVGGKGGRGEEQAELPGGKPQKGIKQRPLADMHTCTQLGPSTLLVVALTQPGSEWVRGGW